MMDEKGLRVVIPVHPGKDVKPGLIRAIIKEAGLRKFSEKAVDCRFPAHMLRS